MSYDLEIGLMQKPEDLDAVLEELGFDKQAAGFHTFFDEENSGNCMNLLHGPADSECWESVSPKVTYSATLEIHSPVTDFDYQKQIELLKSLQDRYGGIIRDTDGEFMID
jgi:hypothetical protein